MYEVQGVLLAAGASRRMGRDKLTLSLAGLTPLERSLNALCAAGIQRVVITVSESTRALAAKLSARSPVPICVVEGGATRQQSVLIALRKMPNARIAAIHDAARCLVSPGLIRLSVAAAREKGSGVVAVPVRDTLRREPDFAILPREGVWATQTPQTFHYDSILSAYEEAERDGFSATDDCAVYQYIGHTPHFIPGELMNQKLTYEEDLCLFEAMCSTPRMGYGEDTHRLAQGRRLVLGGVEIPFHMGLFGHSDADALTHAIIDALLGAACLGDIGRMFPDTDPAYEGICSLRLLERAAGAVREKGYRITNIDATVVAQQPKLHPYLGKMQESLAASMEIAPDRVSVKATTPEELGPEGRTEGITVRCVALLE